MDRNHRRLWRLAALWGVLVLSVGCQEQITNPESLQVDPQDAVVHAIPARPLPLAAAAARLAGLDIEARFRTIAVPFPSMLEVGTCFTQVTKRERPVPFTLDRIAFEAPQAAIDEADGATIVLEYRFLARSGRIIEAARCRVPKSQLAIDQVFGQFTEHGLGARRGTLKAALAKGTTGLANGWVVSVDPGSFLQGGVVATMSGDGLCGTEENPCILDGVETEQCDSPHQEWDEDLDECGCANGSNEWDCWLDPNPGGSGPGGPTPPGSGGGETGGDASDSLNDLIDVDPFALLSDIPCHLIPVWGDLASTTVSSQILNRHPNVVLQDLTTAAGPVVNLDEFSISVDLAQLPDSISEASVFDHIRSNLVNLTVGHPGTFSYYVPGEETLWLSSGEGPLGTYFSINLPAWLSASVVTSAFSSGSYWTFSTIRSPQNGSHPVSGHRSFTWTEFGGTGTLAIRGVDRVSGGGWSFVNFFSNLFESGDGVWQNFLLNLAEMLGPSSQIGNDTQYRPNWALLEAILIGDADVSDLPGCAA